MYTKKRSKSALYHLSQSALIADCGACGESTALAPVSERPKLVKRSSQIVLRAARAKLLGKNIQIFIHITSVSVALCCFGYPCQTLVFRRFWNSFSRQLFENPSFKNSSEIQQQNKHWLRVALLYLSEERAPSSLAGVSSSGLWRTDGSTGQCCHFQLKLSIQLS